VELLLTSDGSDSMLPLGRIVASSVRISGFGKHTSEAAATDSKATAEVAHME
jgi:hypothetical protein